MSTMTRESQPAFGEPIARPDPHEATAAGAHILVVDDEADVRELISMKLTRAGYTVTCAADGLAARKLLQGDLPDLVVLDIAMPRLSGLELCEELRDEPRTLNLPVILLTARAQFDSIAAGFAAGANCYLVKPFSPRMLVREIEAQLSPDADARKPAGR